MPRALWLGSILLVASACRAPTRTDDPWDYALHTDRIGQSVVIDGEAPPPAEEPPPGLERTTPGRYGGDIDELQHLVETQWASRAIHERLDAVDVAQAFEKLRKDVGRRATRDEVARAMRQALCGLGDGHLRVSEASMNGTTLESGLDVQAVGGSFVIAAADDRYGTGPRAPKRGDVIVGADEVPVAELARAQCLRPGSTAAQREHLAARSLGRQQRATGESPRPEQLRLQRPGGRAYTLPLKWQRAESDTPSPCVRGSRIGSGVGRLDIETFACADAATFEHELRSAIDAMGPVQDVIVDLRRNEGGADEQARAAARRFVTAPTTWMRFRHHEPEGASGAFQDEAFEPAPGQTIGAKRVLVLTGPGCFSTCEIFASVLATQRHVTLVGQPTAGGVGNPKPHTLPLSGVEVTIPGTVYALPGTDAPIEGRGVPVDVEVRATPDDIAAGRDVVLDEAMARVGADPG